jgi:hypothetical protein
VTHIADNTARSLGVSLGGTKVVDGLRYFTAVLAAKAR